MTVFPPSARRPGLPPVIAAARADLPLLPVLAASLGVLALIAGVWNWDQGLRRQARIDAATRVDLGALRVLSTMKDLETGERGMLLFGQDRLLQPYRDALTQIGPGLAAVQADRLQAGLAPAVGEPDLGQLVAAKQRLAADAIATFHARGAAAALAMLAAPADRDNPDKQAMDAVRAEVARIRGAADLAAASARREERRRGAAGTLATLVLTVLACVLFALHAVARWRAQQRVQALLDGVLENAPAGVGMLDRGGRFLRLNHNLAGLGDRPVAVGASLADLLGDAAIKVVEPSLAAVLQDGRSASNLEVAVPAGAGAARQLALSLYPLFAAGSPQAEGAGVIAQDITARKLSEQKLRGSEQRFRTLLDATSAIIWTARPDGMIEGEQGPWTRFTGQDVAALRGAGWLDCVHPEDRDPTMRAWAAALAAAAPFEITHRLRRRDGAWRDMAVSVAPVRDDPPDGAGAGTVREWVGSHTDITERRAAEQALAEAKDAAETANLAKSQFIANMSHELRTPLSAVIGYSELLAEEIEDLGNDALLSDVRKIERNARHLLSLINDVLDLSKIEADRLTMYAENFSFDTLAGEVTEAMEPLVARNGNTLEWVRHADIGLLHTDQVKLRQCLYNLLSNAAKFTERGRIVLSARREAVEGVDWIEIAVRDEGIGMSEEQLARLFQRFAQADASTTRQFGGTGLGLAITRAFARKLGGEITATSAPGRGSIFVLRVPAVLPGEAEGTRAQGGEAPDGRAPGTPGANLILVVDDDAATRELLTRFLIRERFEVEAAADGRAGLDAARRLRPRAVLLDVTMPLLDGWSVLHAIRTDPEIGAMPVVMVTVVNEQSLGFSLGATDYLIKPIEWESLKRVIEPFRLRGNGGFVLVVDDDADARARLRAMLARNGWAASEAANGREALACVAAQRPALVLLDLMMPEMDGFAFLRRFRAMPGMDEVPVVVLTARDISAADRAALEPGADRIIQKGSMSMHELARELRALAPPAAPPAATDAAATS